MSDGYRLPRTSTGVHMNPLEGVAHLNVTKLSRADGAPFNLVDPQDLGEAERQGRRQVRMYEEVFRRYVPGFDRARVIDIGARVGVRETRLIHGDAVLTEAHVRECVKPVDRIACSSWPLETDGRGPVTNWEFLPDGEHYGIPWGCLVVKGFDNLLVAGRNLSATHAAQASVRVTGPSMAMGEAAGAAAAASLSRVRTFVRCRSKRSRPRCGATAQSSTLFYPSGAPESCGSAAHPKSRREKSMNDDLFERGLAIRRQVLGAQYGTRRSPQPTTSTCRCSSW